MAYRVIPGASHADDAQILDRGRSDNGSTAADYVFQEYDHAGSGVADLAIWHGAGEPRCVSKTVSTSGHNRGAYGGWAYASGPVRNSAQACPQNQRAPALRWEGKVAIRLHP